jgi:ATP-dependent helicase/nuclease subunit B
MDNWMHPEHGWIAQIHAALQARQVHPARCVVVLPFAQLLALANASWAATYPNSFVPRFETLTSWSERLPRPKSVPTDLGVDMAWDFWTAQHLLHSAGLGRLAADLAPTLLRMACELAPVAAAQAPEQRIAWGESLRPALGTTLNATFLSAESAVAQAALLWASHTSYSTDCLFAEPEQLNFEMCMWLPSNQAEPVRDALAKLWGDLFHLLEFQLPLAETARQTGGSIEAHESLDRSELVDRCVALVREHAIRSPGAIAVVAIDRLLTRRIHAQLLMSGVPVVDESGWKLSTSQSGLKVMLALNAMSWNASVDDVIHWVKHTPSWRGATLDELELELRRNPVRLWRDVEAKTVHAGSDLMQNLWRELNGLRYEFQQARTLSLWLKALQDLLQRSGQWTALQHDIAGALVLEVLHLSNPDCSEVSSEPWSRKNLSLTDVVHWIESVLERQSFIPTPELADEAPVQGSVHILPLQNLAARPWQLVVLPGCDETRLNVSRVGATDWTIGARQILGLPSRDELQTRFESLWSHAFKAPRVVMMWHSAESSGELIQPSSLVLDVLRQQAVQSGQDLRPEQAVTLRAQVRPQPALITGFEDMMPRKISASSFHDMRLCPYRFFARQILGLKPAGEFEFDIDRRIWGQWLHEVLKRFHEAWPAGSAPDNNLRALMLDEAAGAVSLEMGLPEDDFLPFATSWPAVRDRYLAWLQGHLAKGYVFEAAEIKVDKKLGRWQLVGRLDRQDRGEVSFVLDYKTEANSKTAARLKTPLEDTQMAFYSVLIDASPLKLGYLNISEKEDTRLYEVEDIDCLRASFTAGMQTDLTQVVSGRPMPALGAGDLCNYCDVRGLCRKDFWETQTP